MERRARTGGWGSPASRGRVSAPGRRTDASAAAARGSAPDMRAPAPAGRARRLRWYGRLQALAPPLLDGLLALFVTGVALTSLVGRATEVVETDAGTAHFAPPDALGIGLLLASTVAISWRRRAPLVVLLLTSGAVFAYHQAGYAPPPLPYGPLLALYALSAVWVPVRSAAAVVVLVLGVVVGRRPRQAPRLETGGCVVAPPHDAPRRIRRTA